MKPNTSPVTKLPTPEPYAAEFTYEFPHLLLGIKEDANGFVTAQIREGGPRQVTYTITTTYSDTPVEEAPLVFRGQNLVRFGGQELSVINDAVAIDKYKLPASSPTAAEYLAKIGQPVMVAFFCTRDLNRSKEHDTPIYRITRTTIILQ